MPATAALSEDDIKRLLSDRSSATQMNVVQKLAAQYATEGAGELNGNEATIANDIFRLLLTRAEVQVRAVLAANVSQSHKLPAEIARKMAADVNEVASPILEHSHVLTDADLIDIIGSSTQTDSGKLQAIARRKTVSETVSDALVDTKIEKVVSTLVQNEGADINTLTFDKIVEHHSDSAQVVESMIQRNAVPVAVVEKVITRLSVTMRQNLERKYGDLAEMKEMRKALDQSLELTSLKMLGFKSTDAELTRLISHLDMSNKLSPFSALSMGNLHLFEVSLARILRVPANNVHMLMRDSQGMRAAYTQAELPESMLTAVELAVNTIRMLEQQNMEQTGSKGVCNPVQLMEHMRELADENQIEGLDYLYSMMQHCMRNNVRANTSAA